MHSIGRVLSDTPVQAPRFVVAEFLCTHRVCWPPEWQGRPCPVCSAPGIGRDGRVVHAGAPSERQ
jgi:hypothetical protein